MKAIICTKYGPPEALRIDEAEKPVPKGDEVLVKVHAASLNKADSIVVTGKPFLVRLMGGGLLRPKSRIPGSDMSGRVESVGKDVKLFKSGDEVFGDLASFGHGALAEFVCTSEEALALKPANISYEMAAAAPMAAGTALQALRDKGEIKPGQKVLINGASGGVGTFAVQIAKSFGAEVTAVCSGRHVDIARSLGADQVIDYTKEDFTQDGQRYDLIIGANGYQPISRYKRALKPQGIYVMLGGKGAQIFQALMLGRLMSRSDGKRFRVESFKPNRRDLEYIGGLMEEGRVVPVIDKRFALDQVSAAFRYIGEGHAQGKVIIKIAGEKAR